ncbi:MAG: hypothetical protein K2X01_04920 [Cyanobacteria bacterium]|nr:hypothetical protein [Cyanobacteriota bacterium]
MLSPLMSGMIWFGAFSLWLVEQFARLLRHYRVAAVGMCAVILIVAVLSQGGQGLGVSARAVKSSPASVNNVRYRAGQLGQTLDVLHRMNQDIDGHLQEEGRVNTLSVKMDADTLLLAAAVDGAKGVVPGRSVVAPMPSGDDEPTSALKLGRLDPFMPADAVPVVQQGPVKVVEKDPLEPLEYSGVIGDVVSASGRLMPAKNPVAIIMAKSGSAQKTFVKQVGESFSVNEWSYQIRKIESGRLLLRVNGKVRELPLASFRDNTVTAASSGSSGIPGMGGLPGGEPAAGGSGGAPSGLTDDGDGGSSLTTGIRRPKELSELEKMKGL